MRILIACEYSGRVRESFAARGHDVVSVDFLPTEVPGNHYQGDVLEYLDKNVHMFDMMIAHPPCTRLANSGVRWLHKPPEGKTVEGMWEDLHKGAMFYKILRDAPIPRKAIENPVMHKYAKELIKPGHRQVVQPWWFGEEAFKATGFELIGLPDLVATNKLIPPKSGTLEHRQWSKVHMASPSPDRWKDRSRTYEGIARAMAEQWG